MKLLINVSKFLLIILIFLIPLTHKESFSILDPDLVWSRFILLAVSIVGLVIFVRNLKSYIKNPIFVLFSFVVLFHALSLLQSKDLVDSLRMVGFLTAILFLYPVVKKVISINSGNIFDLIKVYVVSFLGVIVFLIFQYYLQTNFGIAIGGVWPVPGYPARYGATFWDVNHFGAYLSSFIFLIAGYFLTVIRGKGRMVLSFALVLVIIIALFAFYLTASRSAFIGFFTGTLVFAGIFAGTSRIAERKKKTGRNWIWTLLGFGIAGVPLGLFAALADRFHAEFLYRSVSFYSHLFLLKVGIQTGLSHFLLGIGTNSFYAYFRQSEWANVYYYIDRSALNFKLPLHSIWLEAFVETGIVSFLFYLAFWIVLIRALYKVYRDSTQVKPDYLALGFMAGIVSFLVGGLFYSYKAEFFWVYVLIAAGYMMSRTKLKFPDRLFSLAVLKEIAVLRTFKRYLLLSASLMVLIIPMGYTFNAMTPGELEIFSVAKSSNPFIFFYQYLLDLFRYVFGSYTFTGRLFSVLFYFGSIFLLVGIYRRFYDLVKSIALAAITVNLFALLVPVIRVSADWYFTFLILLGAGFLLMILGKKIKPAVHVFKLRYKVLFVLLVFSALVSNFSAYRFYKNSYSSDLTFLLELAGNRKIFDKAYIGIDSSVDENFLQYYCEEPAWRSNSYYESRKCIVSRNISLQDAKNYQKIVYIGSEEYINKILNVAAFSKPPVRLNSGEYSVLIYDFK